MEWTGASTNELGPANFEDLTALAKKITWLDASHAELTSAGDYLANKIESGESLDSAERECAAAILRIARNVPILLSEHQQHDKLILEAEKALQTPERIEKRRTAALRILNLHYDSSPKEQAVVSIYNSLEAAYSRQKADTVYRTQIEGKTYRLFWSTDTERKMAIIRIIREHLYTNSVHEDAVIQRLHRAGIKSLPAKSQ
ncbi:MAG: hypothetical protein EA369_04015 [Bradymonadales bacterium]|nr:MAG: hypothetical protein EA369_04015 [Bradymonadales bacterium]